MRNLIARKNEEFRRRMIGRQIDVLTLEDGSAISSNFVRVEVPAGSPVNEWIAVFVVDLTEDGLQATRTNFFSALESSSKSRGF